VSTTIDGDLGRHWSWLQRIAPDTHLDQACGITAFANSPGGIATPEEMEWTPPT